MKLCVICVVSFVLFVVNFSWGYSSCTTPSLRFGRIRSRQRGKSVKFLCNVGYHLAGDRTAFCINGSWDMPLPKCVRPSCPKKEKMAPINGVALPSLNGAVVMFYCQQGYEMNGPGTIYCDGFRWDNNRPSCIPSDTKPSFFCDFESEDICHWSQDLNHDMDWVRDNFYTPTGSSMPTGPSFDHTKGDRKDGHYMYIESSSRRINDTARLISPVFGKMENNVCLEFWYHMYGKTIGTLRAYVKKITDPWPLESNDAIFTKKGNQGNIWLRAIIDLGPILEDFQIVLEGVRGNGYVSDMAVDDIRIIPNCSLEDYIESSTEYVTPSSELIKTVDTCEQRCGHKAFGNESALVIACDCDDFCYETSRCCPDYVDMCFAGFSTSESSTTPEVISDDPTGKTTSKIVSFQDSQKELNLSSLTTVPHETSTVRKWNKITTLAFTTNTYVEEKVVHKNPLSNNESNVIFFKPKKPATPHANYDRSDVLSKVLNKNKMMPLLSSALPVRGSDDTREVSMQEMEDDVEKITRQKDYPFKVDDDNPEYIGEIKTEFNQVLQEEPNFKSVSLTLGIVGGTILLGIFAGVALIKFKFIVFGKTRINSGQGNSQSDVRYLTADEVLDFALDRDYDNLSY